MRSLLLVILACAGCRPPAQPESDQSLRSLRTQLVGLSNEVDLLRSRQRLHEFEFEPAIVRTIKLDPTSRNYQKIETGVLPLLIAEPQFTPYLDGYKVQISIGNPHQITFEGFEITAQWRNGPTNNFDAWLNSLTTVKYSQTESLIPGTWVRTEFIVSPVGSSAVKDIEIRIDLSTIKLRTLLAK